ncbi:MAG: Maf family protein [Elainellaceae cyanobacterium]
MGTPTFVLASASSARRRLLHSVGIEPVVMPSQFDESSIQADTPAELVRSLAQSKAEVIVAQLTESASHPIATLVMGCDSVLALEGEVYGKPADDHDAIARWQSMRGRVGQLYTGHALVDLSKPRALVRCQVTQVFFADVSDRQIEAYVATGEPLHCAGCFALEGRGGAFVEKIEGCHSNVIGLSLPLLRQMLEELGYDIADFW